MGGLSVWHWVVIGAVFILLFGAKRLPDAARGLGRSLRILKSEVGAMHVDEGQAAVAGAVAGTASDVRVSPTGSAPLGNASAR